MTAIKVASWNIPIRHLSFYPPSRSFALVPGCSLFRIACNGSAKAMADYGETLTDGEIPKKTATRGGKAGNIPMILSVSA